VTVGLCSGLAGYVIHAARVNRIPKQVVTVQRLTDMAGVEESPAISPDGKSVTFVAMSGGRRQIWIQQIVGGTPRAITNDDGDHEAPRWSADSSRLIYFSSGGIWEIPAAGGEAHRMVDALAPGDLNHAGKLAFFRRGDGGVELMVDARPIATLTGDATYLNLRWSPDDKKIAFLQDMQVMVLSASGGKPVRAAVVTVQGFAWVPDNSGLIVSSTVSRSGELWFIPRAENGSPTQLTFGELSYKSPDIGPKGSLVVSRQGLYPSEKESDIVMISGLKW